MFKGLDNIAWERLEHAYGEASDVPQLIRNLVKRDEKVVDKAIYELFGNIYHQGTVYPASAPAVPFLAEALGSMVPQQQARLLGLLAAMAQGHGYYDVHQHLPFAKEAMEESWVDDPDATLSKERSIVRDTTLAVFAQWDVIAPYLEAPDRSVRLAALYVLATLGQNDISDVASPDEAAAYLGVRPPGFAQGHWAGQIRRHADLALKTVTDPLERAAWLRALSQLAARDHAGLQLEQASSCSALEQYIIVWSCAVAEIKKAPELPGVFAPLLANLVDRREELRKVVESGIWPWDDEFEPGLLLMFARLPEPDLDRVAAACARLISEAPSLVFHFDIVLSLILGDRPPRIPDDPCALSTGRREIASAFLAKPRRHDPWWFWHKKNGNASAVCAQLGVPHDRAVWLKWLGLPHDHTAWLKWLGLSKG